MLKKLAARDDVELVAVVDPATDNCNCVASQCHTEARSEYASLFGKIDGAVIAAPTSLHHPNRPRVFGCRRADFSRKNRSARAAPRPMSWCRSPGVAASRCKSDILNDSVLRFNPRPAKSARQDNIDAVRASGFTFRSTDVGVVLDLMIHDIDLVLSMAGCRVQSVEAIGSAVVGPHEDIANARLEFENGCVASLSASRVSYENVRRMHAWSADGFAAIDFAARTLTTVHPSETLLNRQFDIGQLTPQQLDYQRTHFAEEHLPKRQETFEAVDTLALESADFIESIRTSREPRVNGEAGRDALAVAERILACLERAEQFDRYGRKAA